MGHACGHSYPKAIAKLVIIFVSDKLFLIFFEKPASKA